MATRKLNFLLMGKTGHGKSAAGNMLLNRKVFKTSANSISETKVVDFNFNQFDDFSLMVVDGPGLEDTDMNKAEDRVSAAKNMKIALAMCYGGIDAFILVIRFPIRFTAEERATIESLKTIFGDRFLSNVIVVVTCGDIFLGSMEENGRDVSFSEWCREQPGAFRDLFKDCNGRFVLFNNWEKDEFRKREQVQQVVQLAQSLKQQPGRYTSQCFDDARDQRERLILELKAPHLRLEFQEKISLLTAAIEKFCTNPVEGDKEKILSRKEDLKREIESENQHYGVLDDLLVLVRKVEENLNDVETLHKLAKELEETRKAKNIWDVIGSVVTAIGVAIALVVPALGAAISGVGLTFTAVGRYAVLSSNETAAEQKETELKKKRES